ncbi:MAG TPA: acyl-CoA thioesterase [Terrimicrobiaceae bacterium]|nr:acyl-CoA thioesterase [Terrimicrobiaceae bacterium]
MKPEALPAIHRHEVVILDSAIDANGHTNNVEYLRWMQAAAISHANATGCTTATIAAGASWVVRSHHVEYLQPTFAGDRIVVLTWVSTFRKASSLRKYLLVRAADRAVVARGETSWVFVDALTGRPATIPTEVSSAFVLLPGGAEPRDGTAA